MENKCPLCSEIMTYFTSRYPKMICINCANSKILDNSGNEVAFYNADFHGGFISIHNINNEQITKEEHICFINNVKCFANEARFGGIVIQKVD